MLDAAIADLASRQLGVFTLEQAHGLGATRSMVERRLRTRRWQRVQPGVYLVSGTPADDRALLMATCLAGGEPSAVSHRTAAASWCDMRAKPPLEATVCREMRRAGPNVLVHRSRDLLPDHVTERDGLPITTPARTLVDLGAVAPWWEVERAMERMLTRRLVTMVSLRGAIVVHSQHGRRGVGTLRRVIEARALGDLPADSVLEAALASVCQNAGLRVPALQHQVTVAGKPRFIDFAYPDLHLAIEVDGYAFHSSPTQFEADRIRGNELALAGWRVLHFTWHQVIHRPTYVAATIRAAIAKLGR